MSSWNYNDGGRKDAGHRGVVRDCVVRSIAIATRLTVVIDGTIQDTYDCSRDGTRRVYGFWRKDGHEKFAV